MDHQSRSDTAGPNARKFLAGNDRVECIRFVTRAAKCFGIIHPQQAGFGSLGVKVARNATGALPFVNVGHNLPVDKIADTITPQRMTVVHPGTRGTKTIECYVTVFFHRAIGYLSVRSKAGGTIGR